jgi:hypothetical protein
MYIDSVLLKLTILMHFAAIDTKKIYEKDRDTPHSAMDPFMIRGRRELWQRSG